VFYIAVVGLVAICLGIDAVAFYLGVTEFNDLLSIFLVAWVVVTFVGLCISNRSIKKTFKSFF